jgi:predicted nucleic acid-binding protein
VPLLVDTGILFALADTSDAWHSKTHQYIASLHDTLLAPVTILPEIAYLLHQRIGPHAERVFIHAVADGEIAVEDLIRRDWRRAEELVGAYEWLGLVDASIVAVAERLKLHTIATTDRRHFGVVRPKHVERFTLVP